MALVSDQAIFLLNWCKLIEFATEKGFVVTGGELYRTTEQQQIYVATGRSKTLDSNHLRRLAGDLNFFLNGKLIYDYGLLKPLGDFWEALHPANRWGGNFHNFKDVPHFEMNISRG